MGIWGRKDWDWGYGKNIIKLEFELDLIELVTLVGRFLKSAFVLGTKYFDGSLFDTVV